MKISNSVRVWLFLVPLIPSILVTIFVLYHLLVSRAHRRALNNHAIILLLSCGLIEELTDAAWYIHFYRTGTVLSSTRAFCLAWVLFGSIMFVSISILMAWASIERHILIFYPNWLATKQKRFYFHYLPLAISILWPTIFYFVMLIILSCDIPFNYKRRLCNRYSCVTGISWVSLLDSIAHYILPAFITVIFSLALLARVLYSKYRIRGRINWRNYKKLAGQLLPISALYMLLQLPPMILYAAYSGGLPQSIANSYYSDALFFNYWVVLFTPFASTMSLSKLGTKCRNLFLFCRRKRAVGPEILTTTRPKLGQTFATVPIIR
jgi:hypothetical protein